MPDSNPDFIALLKYRTSADGGRQTPAFSGYRPTIKFDFAEMQTSGQQTFIDKETV
jgi:translation elongation factor EF-Tu-like GTPase